MMQSSPLVSTVLFHLGPIAITRPVVTTWVIMLAARRRLPARHAPARAAPGPPPDRARAHRHRHPQQIDEVIRKDARPLLPLLGTLFIFLVTANLCGVLPGVEAPTSKLETPAALALIVFVSVHYFGVRARGLGGYLASFAEPKLDHAAAQCPLRDHANLLPDDPPVRQRHERRVRHRARPGAGRAVRPDSVHGARNPGRPRAGLHLHRAGNGLHRRRARRCREKAIEEVSWIQRLISIIGAALAVSIGSIGPALAEGRSVAAAMDAIARQPEAAGTISRTLFVGLAMIETMAIYCLVVALLLLFANPYAG